MAALAVAVPARAGLINVGGEGQLIMGEVAATGIGVAIGAQVFRRLELGSDVRRRCAMYAVSGPILRLGLVRTGDGPADGIELEIWHLPHQGLGLLLPTISPPLDWARSSSTMAGGSPASSASRCAPCLLRTSLATGWRAYLDLDGHRKG